MSDDALYDDLESGLAREHVVERTLNANPARMLSPSGPPPSPRAWHRLCVRKLRGSETESGEREWHLFDESECVGVHDAGSFLLCAWQPKRRGGRSDSSDGGFVVSHLLRSARAGADVRARCCAEIVRVDKTYQLRLCGAGAAAPFSRRMDEAADESESMSESEGEGEEGDGGGENESATANRANDPNRRHRGKVAQPWTVEVCGTRGVARAWGAFAHGARTGGAGGALLASISHTSASCGDSESHSDGGSGGSGDDGSASMRSVDATVRVPPRDGAYTSAALGLQDDVGSRRVATRWRSCNQLRLRTLLPRWSGRDGCFVQRFAGTHRVLQASSKNFMLEAAAGSTRLGTLRRGGSSTERGGGGDRADRAMLQFGKRGPSCYSLDYKEPLTAMVAFAIALTQSSWLGPSD